jgi:hypothetical protein
MRKMIIIKKKDIRMINKLVKINKLMIIKLKKLRKLD